MYLIFKTNIFCLEFDVKMYYGHGLLVFMTKFETRNAVIGVRSSLMSSYLICIHTEPMPLTLNLNEPLKFI